MKTKKILIAILVALAYQTASYFLWGSNHVSSKILYSSNLSHFKFIVVEEELWETMDKEKELLKIMFKKVYHSVEEVPSDERIYDKDKLIGLKNGFIYKRKSTESLFNKDVEECSWVSTEGAESRKDTYIFVLGIWFSFNDYREQS